MTEGKQELTQNETSNIVEQIKEFFIKVVKALKTACTFMVNIVKLYIHHKKKMKKEYYQSVSNGKSNNWRKVHGLPVKRKVTGLC